VKARALMSFSAYNLYAHKEDIIEINDPNVFLDLQQANFVEQVDRVSKDD